MNKKKLTPQRRASPDRFAATRVLFYALIEVHTLARMFARGFDELRQWIDGCPFPLGFQYCVPPDDSDDDELRELINTRRESYLRPMRLPVQFGDSRFRGDAPRGTEFVEVRSQNWLWYDKLDLYHHDERHLRKSIAEAKAAADAAAPEIDDPQAGPLNKESTRIRRDLQQLGGAVPSVTEFGDFPPVQVDVADRIRQSLPAIDEWIERLKAFVNRVIPTTAPGESNAGRPARGSLDARAVAYFVENKSRDLTIPGIAQALCCHNTSLYKCEHFMAAWRAWKAARAGTVRRGSKDAESREITAPDDV